MYSIGHTRIVHLHFFGKRRTVVSLLRRMPHGITGKGHGAYGKQGHKAIT